jgi:hypothetical protein
MKLEATPPNIDPRFALLEFETLNRPNNILELID